MPEITHQLIIDFTPEGEVEEMALVLRKNGTSQSMIKAEDSFMHFLIDSLRDKPGAVLLLKTVCNHLTEE